MDNSQNRPISGQTESIRDVTYADILSDNEYPDHIKTVPKRRRSMAIDPDTGRSAKFAALSVVHGLDGRPEAVAAASLDLDEGNVVLAAYDEVDIAMPAAKPMRHHLPPLLHEPTGGNALTKQTEILTRFRHGASLSRHSDKSRTGMTRIG